VAVTSSSTCTARLLKRGRLLAGDPRPAQRRVYLSVALAWGQGRLSVDAAGNSEGDVVTRCMAGLSYGRVETNANAPFDLRLRRT